MHMCSRVIGRRGRGEGVKDALSFLHSEVIFAEVQILMIKQCRN